MRRMNKPSRRIAAAFAVVLASVVGLSRSTSAQDAWWMTGFFRASYPTTQECARLLNGAYGSVWFTQNTAYVDWGGTCNVQHQLASCWLKARSWGESNGVATNMGSQVCNASSTATAQGNVTIGGTDTGVISQMWYWDMNNSTYLYGTTNGP